MFEASNKSTLTKFLFYHFQTYYRLQDEIQHYKDELSLVKSEMFTQEVEIREQIVNSYDELIKKRDAEFQRKLENAKEIAKRPLELRVSTFVSFSKMTCKFIQTSAIPD